MGHCRLLIPAALLLIMGGRGLASSHRSIYSPVAGFNSSDLDQVTKRNHSHCQSRAIRVFSPPAVQDGPQPEMRKSQHRRRLHQDRGDHILRGTGLQKASIYIHLPGLPIRVADIVKGCNLTECVWPFSPNFSIRQHFEQCGCSKCGLKVQTHSEKSFMARHIN